MLTLTGKILEIYWLTWTLTVCAHAGTYTYTHTHVYVIAIWVARGDENGLPKAIQALIVLVFVRAGFLFTLLKYYRESMLLITEQIYSVASTHKGVN